MTFEISPRTGVAFEVRKDQTLTVIDLRGKQVTDLLAFRKDDVREVIHRGVHLITHHAFI